jgi:ABC-2 type transport system permease protein
MNPSRSLERIALGTAHSLRSTVLCAPALAYALRLGWHEAWEQRAAFAGTFLSYAVVLSMWSHLYRLLPEATLARASLSHAAVVWYLALTEIVAFSIGHAYRQVQDEIKDGSAAAYLVRPIGYVALTGAQELGRMAARMSTLAAPACALAWALTGRVPFGPAAVLPLAISLAAGAGLLLAVQLLIGLSTAWLGTARPVFFIVQKLIFVLGGLLLPLDAYPPALVRIGAFTPFPAMLYAPASLALDSSGAHVVRVLALQAFWLAAALLALAAVSAACERRVVRTGIAS